jgi:hypothetical protein
MRGSRKHVLDWVEQPGFPTELFDLLRPVGCSPRADKRWMPLSHAEHGEARLETFGPAVMPDHAAWPALASWWLKHRQGANTPNWDLALNCDIEGRHGLILVEAKANVPELVGRVGTDGLPAAGGKALDRKASDRSGENHTRIGEAIEEVRLSLLPQAPALSISRDRHYQLSNRIAFAWRLASLGIPTVLVYLGFTGDEGIRYAGEPFRDGEHWREVLHTHICEVGAEDLLERRVDTGAAPFWILVRDRLVQHQTVPPGKRSDS